MGTPRIAGRLLRRVRDFANVAGATEVDAKTADAALNRLEVDNLGLDAMDRRYLHMIADIYWGGPVGVETLAAGLSEPRDTIDWESTRLNSSHLFACRMPSSDSNIQYHETHR